MLTHVAGKSDEEPKQSAQIKLPRFTQASKELICQVMTADGNMKLMTNSRTLKFGGILVEIIFLENVCETTS